MNTPSTSELHLWHVDPSQSISPELFARYESLLTADEYARYKRFVFEKGRREALFTRALVRTVLSTYRPHIAPEQWRFGANEHGRPFVTGPEVFPDLSFNLSHATNRIVCLVGTACVVGVDIEPLDRVPDALSLARRFFAPAEYRELESLPTEEAARQRFLHYWTLKESYIKAKGTGLAIPLEDFAFRFEGPQRAIHISFEPRLKDDPSAWWFRLLQLGETHLVACGVSDPERRARDIQLFEALPLT